MLDRSRAAGCDDRSVEVGARHVPVARRVAEGEHLDT